MKLGLSISALLLAAATVAAWDEYSCHDKKCQAECTPTNNGRDGDVVGPRVVGSPWCYLQSSSGDAIMMCTGDSRCRLDADATAACVTKDSDEALGGCGE